MFEALAELILQVESNSYRFENFCIALVGKHEGVKYLPTSQSWDMGRDGRASHRGMGTHANILCATLNENLDGKSEADVLRLTASAAPDRIAYCSSQKLSELRCNEISVALERHAQGKSIIVYGAKQLASIADDNEENRDLFAKFYGAELQEIRATILSKHAGAAPSAGLRLALLAFGSQEGAELRDELLRSVVLDRLTRETPATVQEIIASFSADLGLPRALPGMFLFNALERASQEGTVERIGVTWRLTEKGTEEQSKLPLQGIKELLDGRQTIRAELERLIGKKFADQQFEAIWTSMLDGMSGMFFANGLEVIRSIEELLSRDLSKEPTLNFRRELERVTNRAVAAITTTELRHETERALLDLFTERQGPAFEWLTRVSERFVSLCSLGLEHETGAALRETLTAQRLVLDSDIILDFLCQGEPDHTTSRDLLLNWLGIGGRILVSPIVLEEVAHNAWISERDFNETETLLGKLASWELRRYIRNPFVRTFHFFKSRASQWGMYIRQYKGNAPGDYTKILSLLRDQLKVEILPATYDDNLSNEISVYLQGLTSRRSSDMEGLEDVAYKIERDGRLMASLASARELAERAGLEEPMLLLSSSAALKAAERAFERVFQGAQLIFNKRAFSYLLSAIPQVGLGAGTLRRALFEFGSHGRLMSSGVRALRLLRSTGEVEFPWAERFTLQRELWQGVKREADRRGITPREMDRQFMEGKSPETTARLIVEAVQQLVVPTKTQEELAQARRRIVELEAKLDNQ